jgi:hypothetical protein
MSQTYLRVPRFVLGEEATKGPSSHPKILMRASVRLFAGVAMIAAAACGESATSPSTARPKALSPDSPVFDYTTTSNALGLSQQEFVVTSAGGSFSLGGLYSLNFPANSVCDPARSTYGPTEWDNDCTTIGDGQSVKIRATFSLTAAGLSVDFSPALRFSPATQVTISTNIFAPVIKANRDFFAKNPSALNPLAILYAPVLGAAGASDYSRDGSVVTHVELSTGTIWRRVKHFSGYSMTSGESCEPAPDNPDCIAISP